MLIKHKSLRFVEYFWLYVLHSSGKSITFVKNNSTVIESRSIIYLSTLQI